MSTVPSRNAALKIRNKQQTESPSEITQDIIDAMLKYSKEKPAAAGLICLGVGFVLGWKLKPW